MRKLTILFSKDPINEPSDSIKTFIMSQNILILNKYCFGLSIKQRVLGKSIMYTKLHNCFEY